MRIIDQSEVSQSIGLFDNSAYTNSHLGWIELENLISNHGSIWLDSIRNTKYLIAILPNKTNLYWLHSFYSTGRPESYPLTEKLKSCFSAGTMSVYTISSHNWFNSLLEYNGFRKCDEIIQMETADIHSNNIYTKFSFEVLTGNEIDNVYNHCESSFPSLWQLGKNELSIAINGANYARMIVNGNKAIAYLLADYESDNCHIERIAVSQDYQNQGVASSLIHQLIIDMESKCISKFSVNTNKNNSSAVSFYKKMNFAISGQIYPVYHRFLHIHEKFK